MASFGIDIEFDGNGLTELDIAGETLVAGDLCYLGNDSKYYKASALTKATSTTEIRISLANIPINTSGVFLIKGKFTKAGLVSGNKYYISESYGQFTNVQPNGTSSNVIRYVGTAHSGNTLEFNTDGTYILADGSEINEVTLAASGGSGHVIQEEGTSLAARTNLNFIGSAVTVTDNPGSSSTDVTIVDSGAHTHSNLPLLETYDQTNADITNAVTEAHNVFNLGSKVVNETGLDNGDVLSFNSTSGFLEYIPQSNGVTDHTALTNIGTNTHAQIDSHISDTTLHYTQASISITESQISDLGNYEPYLGVPAADGYVLTSTTGGARTWTNITAGGPEVDTLDSVTTRGSITTNSISTGAIGVTGNVTASGQFSAAKYTSTGSVVLETSTTIEAVSDGSQRHYIDANNSNTSSTFDILANTGTYISGNVVFSVSQTGVITLPGSNTSTQWNSAYIHSLLTSGNPHQVTGAQVALTGYVMPGSTSAVLTTDSTNVAIGKLEKAIEDITLSGGMVSFNIMEGNGVETTAVTNGETIHFEQGTGMQVELTSTASGGQLTFTNTSPNTNLIHTGEVTGATALTIANGVVDRANLNISGTPTTSTYLKYNSTGSGLIWEVPPNTNTWRGIDNVPVNGQISESITSNWAYDHNAGTGNLKHIPAAGSSGQFLAYNGVWATPPNTVYSGWDLFTNGTDQGTISNGENVNFATGTGLTQAYSATNNTITHSVQDIYLRNDLKDYTGQGLNIGVGGEITFYDGAQLEFGTTSDHQVYWDDSKSRVTWKMITGTGLNMYDDVSLRFTFERTTGYFTCTKAFATSSRDLKENIVPYNDSALDIINAIDIVKYDFKDGSKNDNIGAIAEDVPDEIAAPDRKSIDVYTTVFVQAKAIQELTERIERLEALINKI